MSSHHGDSGCIALSSLPVCFALAPALRGFIVVHPLSPRACMLVPRTVATLSHTHGLSACYPSHLVMSSHHGDSGSIALSSLPVCFAPTPALRGFILVSLLSPRACLLVCRIITYVHPSSDGLLCLVHTHTAILAKVPRQFHSSTLHGPLGFSSSPSLRTTLIRAQSPCR